MQEQLYSASEAAKILKVHPNTIKNWYKSGKIEGRQIGNGWIRIPESEITKIKEEPRVKGVYLAGKVRKNDWRGGITKKQKRDTDLDRDASRFDFEINNRTYSYEGPWFVSCDHGCYHGEHSHGAGANKPEEICMGRVVGEHHIYATCLHSIDMSDIVFAWIDATDCHGTLAEIGYAYSRGKKILIGFSEEINRKEFWFIEQFSNFSGTFKNPNLAVIDLFNRID